MTKQIRALSRGLAVVSAINRANAPMSLQALHGETSIDKATLLRILATLEHDGWVYRGMSDSHYRLTYQLHELGTHVSVNDAVAQVSAPVLDRLQRALHWPSDIAVYDGQGMAIVETSRRRGPFVVNRELLGYRTSMLKSAMGRVYLAFCDDKRRRTILARLRERGGAEGRLAGDAAHIDRLVTEIRERGYALRDPALGVFEYEEEVGAMAVPVMVMGDVQASLNLVWLRRTEAEAEIETVFAPALREAAEELSQAFLDQSLY